jgi:hypothetical protein
LFVVLSLLTLYLTLLGCALMPCTRVAGGLLERTALAMSAGILVNFALVLTGQSIGLVFLAGTILGALGLLRLLKTIRHDLTENRGRTWSVLAASGIGYILTVHYFKILSEPLLHWDARSVWFFHAKMIWTEGALRQQTGWNHPSIAFSSPDYPELIPAIAAQLAYLKGFWNEFFPKGSLVLMLIPATLWIFSFFNKRVSFLFLLLALFFSLPDWLWNGYMDGYLVLYCSAALLLFGRYLAEGRPIDLYSGVCSIGIAASIKNEGLLFAVCLITSLMFLSLDRPVSNLRAWVRRIRTDSIMLSVLLISIAPTVMWAGWKTAWGLQNSLTAAPAQSWSRLSSRLFDGRTADYVLDFLAVRGTSTWILIVLIAACILFSSHQKMKLHRGVLVALMTSALYICGIYAIYLSTPANLNWHLSTAGTRTMVAGTMALLVGIFFLLSSFEVTGEKIEQPGREVHSAT